MPEERIEEQKRRLVTELEADIAPRDAIRTSGQLAPQVMTLNNGLSDAAFHLFLVMAEDWFRKATNLYRVSGSGDDLGPGLCGDLAKFGLITSHTAKTFRSGGQFKFYLPTDAGIEKLRNANAKFMPVRGDAPHGDNSDGTHIWYQNRIERALTKRGWNAKIEMVLKEKRVDVGAALDGGRVMHAYEVVNEGYQKELANLRAIDEGWHKVIFCVGNREIRDTLKAIINATLGTGLDSCIEYAYLPSFN
jgi:hypothetical protein